MSSKIDIKYSSTPGVIPTTSSINLAEVAFNTYDGKVYYKKDNGVEYISELVSTTHTGSVNISGSTTIKGDLIVVSGSGDFYIHGHKQFNYGMFQHNQTITGSANTSHSFQLDTINEAHEISIVSGSRITFENNGMYNIHFLSQIYQGAGKSLINVWFKKNGINIPDSANSLHVESNNYNVISGNFMKTFSSGDYVELMWQSDLSTTTFPYVEATGNIPSIPSLVITISQVR